MQSLTLNFSYKFKDESELRLDVVEVVDASILPVLIAQWNHESDFITYMVTDEDAELNAGVVLSDDHSEPFVYINTFQSVETDYVMTA
jgi:hypothetical protein